ncbi:MAG: 23S rRNA (cytidine(2498)-2'-O)-methyltransferase RlmM [Archangium sp.]|nr:23S rRNA (cytidine(2498)-2'-O)-methyltransferase RlmM [Archangium sp.]
MNGLPRAFLPPTVGRWVWTSREGFEAQLFEELAWAKAKPRALGPALVESDPVRDPAKLVFARMGFQVDALAVSPLEVKWPAGALLPQVWVPDATLANGWASRTKDWEAQLHERHPGGPDTPWKAHEANGFLGQVCLVTPELAAVGLVRAREAMSLSAGGRTRMRRGEAPSRAAMKLDEALEWYGVSPGKGDACVDLGAAPGGWTRKLLERGARVLAIDPGPLAEDIRANSKVRHVRASAFGFEPPESVDWLFCDMAWRPLEVSQLLAKWSRRSWATHLVANIKLPMKDKWPTLWRVRATLEESGWKHLAVRQLYHDRDEVTVTARCR